MSVYLHMENITLDTKYHHSNSTRCIHLQARDPLVLINSCAPNVPCLKANLIAKETK